MASRAGGKSNGEKARRGGSSNNSGSRWKQTLVGVFVGVLVVLGATRAAQKATSHTSSLRGSFETTTTKDITVVTVVDTGAASTTRGEEPRVEYLTIIDAGSSGCRAHVFSYTRLGLKAEVNPQHKSFKVKPGLSSYADAPEKAGESVVGLLEFISGEIPKEQRAESPIYLKATAGLRLVEPAKRTAILASVAAVFESSEFAFDATDGAKVIAGTEEGGFGWMSVNFLMHSMDNKEPMGVVEMGGASAQVTQLFAKTDRDRLKKARKAGTILELSKEMEGDVPEDSLFDFDMDGEHFDLYAHSYLGYGLEKAREAVTQYLTDNNFTEDPCVNAGFNADPSNPTVYDGILPGAGDAAKCADVVEKALFKDADLQPSEIKCSYASCSNIQGAYQPPHLADTKLLVFENFFYTYKMLGSNFDTPDGYSKASPSVCDKTYTALVDSEYPKDGSDKGDLTKLCFSAVYLPLFLEKGLNIPKDLHLTIQQDVGDFDIDWSLGAAIREANNLSTKQIADNKL